MRSLKSLWKRIGTVTFLFGVIAVAWSGGCKAEPTIPKQNIIFSVGDSGERVKFGLVNADGSGLEYLEFQQPKSYYATFPVWSPDKTKIVYLNAMWPSTSGSGDLLWVDVAQAKARHICSENATEAGRITDRPRWTPDGKWWIVSASGMDIVLASPQTCKIEQTLVSSPQDEYVNSPDLSVQNELVYDMVRGEEAYHCLDNVDLGHIMVKNLDTNQTRELGRGLLPSWSPDGEWIVFTKQDGLYLVRREGSEKRRLLEVAPWWELDDTTIEHLRASWSPDGEWVVYDRMVQRDGEPHFDIYKLNVDTGEEVKIAEDGGNPHWYWEPRPIVGRSQ